MSGTWKALLHYLVTGGTAAVIDIKGFALMCSANVPILLAAACSFAIATVVNFLLSARWVFRTTPTPRRYLVFLLGAAAALMVNVALTYAGMRYLELPAAFAKVAAIGATFLLNFWINARIVFPKGPT